MPTCSHLRMMLMVVLAGITASDGVPKRGLSGLQGCGDATALGLQASWHYNWALWPTTISSDGTSYPSGTTSCHPPRSAEFVPMFWGFHDNLTSAIWPGIREDWKALGVKYILGFNEPDNAGQSNLTPAMAAEGWAQLDAFAATFDPPLGLVGPGMTHWDDSGGSPWLDQFLGNLSSDLRSRIKFLAQHDYSGGIDTIITRADAAYKKYGLKVWLTEFAVGSSAARPKNDAFIAAALPKLDAADSVARYAWFSARNVGTPKDWVYQSNLLEPLEGSGWDKHANTACTEMKWLSQHGSDSACLATTLNDAGCVEPKTAVYQSGSPENCYCANTSACNPMKSTWQDMYVHRGGLPANWTRRGGTACGANEMLWLSQHGSVAVCQASAVATLGCSMTPTKVVLRESGPTHNCYCLNTSACTAAPSSWLEMYVEPPPPVIAASLTSTGTLYKLKA
eukprot:m.5893 g.5893  ORF g.5893 m.5893 type:complete len:451 (+) comp3761_c0_seq1:64-1416(+)